MGTIANSAVRGFQASSTAILVMIALRGQYDGRETVTCEACGRAQFNRGQGACIACRQTLMVMLEPLPCESDAETPVKVEAATPGLRAGLRLRELRHVLGLSQPQLADAAGCARTLITKYENGAVTLRLSSIARLAQGFHLSLAEVLDDENITVKQLAVLSLTRSPGDGELMRLIIKCLPKFTKHSRYEFLNTVSLLAPHVRSESGRVDK